MVESSLVTYGENIIDLSIGSTTTVEFNFLNIWNLCKQASYIKDFMVFHHVHPEGLLMASITDYNCAHGFFLAFKVPIKFNIICFNNSDLNSLDNKQITYIYDIDGFKVISNESAKDQGLQLNSNTLLKVLKLLSYNNGGV